MGMNAEVKPQFFWRDASFAERAAELLSAPHAVAIDATRPLERVADDVIACAQAWPAG